MDIRPLTTSPEFRRVWIGDSLSGVGSAIIKVAIPVQVYELSGSSAAVGAIALAQLAPIIIFGLLGGSLADAMDRRKLALLTQCGSVIGAIGLTVQAVVDLDALWLLYLLAAVQASLASLYQPARRTFPARLLPLQVVPSAITLNQLSFQVTLIGGPVVGGALIAVAGLQTAYAIDAVTFLPAIYAIWRMRALPPQGGGTTSSLRSVVAGARYAARHRLIAGLFLADLNTNVLASPVALFPALAATQFGGGAAMVGGMYGALGAGGLVASIFSGSIGRVRRQGRAMLIAIALWGVALGAFALSPWFWLVLVGLAIAGMAGMIMVVFKSTILQTIAPDTMRGRLSGLEYVVGAGGPRLGDVRAGAVASATSPEISAIIGGIACLLGVGLLAMGSPALTRYDSKAQRAQDEQPD